MYLGNQACPKGHTDVVLLATTNEWKYLCQRCDRRFNEQGQWRDPEVYPQVAPLRGED